MPLFDSVFTRKQLFTQIIIIDLAQPESGKLVFLRQLLESS